MSNLKIKDDVRLSGSIKKLDKSQLNPLIYDAVQSNQKLYHTFKSHSLKFKQICLIACKTENVPRSIILYLMFMAVEMFIKAEIIDKLKLNSYVEIKSSKLHQSGQLSLRKIGHQIFQFLYILRSKKEEYPEFGHLLILLGELEKVCAEFPIDKNRYCDLRYNCKDDGELIFEDDSYSMEICMLAEEVLKHVY